MKKMYLIGLIVLVEVAFLSFSRLQEEKIHSVEAELHDVVSVAIAPSPIAIKEPKPKPKKPEIQCPTRITISAEVDRTFYEHGYPPDGNRLILHVYNQSLSLSGHELKKLPKEILNTECIQKLSVNRNLFTEIPVQLFKHPHLERLDFSNNKITTFPNIKAPTSLKRLNLSGNNITEIPASIKYFTNLEYLYLEDMDSLEKIHDDIKECKNLKYLVVKNTPLSRSYSKVIKLRKILPNTQVFWYSK